MITNVSRISSPRDVADEFGIAYNTFRIKFKRQVGVSPGQFLRNARIDYMKRMLLNTDKSIQEVCNKAGFESAPSGMKAFKKVTRKTMAEYKKIYKYKS